MIVKMTTPVADGSDRISHHRQLIEVVRLGRAGEGGAGDGINGIWWHGHERWVVDGAEGGEGCCAPAVATV